MYSNMIEAENSKGDTPRNRKRVISAGLVKVPLGYLKKGDHFVAILHNAIKFKGALVVTGTAHMDGPWVAEHGFRGEPQNLHWTDPARTYVNVQFDGEVYNRETPDFRVNDSLFERDGWAIYVTADVAKRIEDDQRLNRDWELAKDEARKEAARQALRDQIARLQQQIDDIV